MNVGVAVPRAQCLNPAQYVLTRTSSMQAPTVNIMYKKQHEILLRCTPVPFSPTSTTPDQVYAHLIGLEMESLLAQEAIAQSLPRREVLFSHLFLVANKGGTFWPVIDLRFLNNLVENPHFQMESIHCLKSILLLGHCMTTLVLINILISCSPQGLAVHLDK